MKRSGRLAKNAVWTQDGADDPGIRGEGDPALALLELSGATAVVLMTGLRTCAGRIGLNPGWTSE
jgi:hypothetical protein